MIQPKESDCGRRVIWEQPDDPATKEEGTLVEIDGEGLVGIRFDGKPKIEFVCTDELKWEKEDA